MASGRCSTVKLNGSSSDHPSQDEYMLPESIDQSSGRPYYYMNHEAVSPRPTPRRTKRLVPDNQKDIKYWEKRKRNNDAAKRSRENKRRLDIDVRQRLVIIEDELNMTKKELTVIKMKFGLPLDQRFLGTDDNGELMATAMSPNEMAGSPPEDDDNSYCAPRHDVRTGAPPPTGRETIMDVNSICQAAIPPASASQHERMSSRMSDSNSPTRDLETIPVKKRKKGRKEWEETLDEANHQENASNEYYPRMMPNNPYPPAALWGPNTAPTSQQGQYHFHSGQMPIMPSSAAAAAAYHQALMDDQHSLPPINAFSNIKEEMAQMHERHQQQQQQQLHQQQPPHMPQERGSPLPQRESYNGYNAPSGLHRGYYVPYTESLEVGDGSNIHTNGPADLSMTKRDPEQNHLPTDHRDVFSRHSNMGIVRPLVGSSPPIVPHEESQPPQEQQHQAQQQQHQAQQQQHQAQQQQHQAQQQPLPEQQQLDDSELSDNSEEEERHGRLEMENSVIRDRLQALSAEVAKMKNFVLKDTIRTDVQ